MTTSSPNDQPVQSHDRRLFLKTLTGSLAVVLVGSESALGRSLLLRPAKQIGGQRLCTTPTTLSQSASATQTATIPLPGGFADPSWRTELWTGPDSPETWSDSYTYVTRTASQTYTLESPAGTFTRADTVSIEPAFSMTNSYSINKGTVTIYYTPSADPGTYSSTVTIAESASYTAKTTCEQDGDDAGGDDGALEVPREATENTIEMMDLPFSIDDVVTRFAHMHLSI